MKRGINFALKQMAFLTTLVVFVLIVSTGVLADAGEKANQLTILYNTEDHDFSTFNIDQNLIRRVETVSGKVDVVHLKDSDDAAGIIESIKSNETVKAVDFEAVAKTVEIPNDKHYEKYQTYMKDLGYENDFLTGPNTVKVAVVDTGVDADHEDLAGRVEESGYNYISDNNNTRDVDGHGTFVAGIISADTNNKLGIAGVCKEANVLIVPYLTLDETGEGDLSGIAAALEDISLRDDIQVVNLSLGFESHNEVLEQLCNELVDKGKTLVCASGNDGGDRLYYPAAYTSTISVGAVNNALKRCTAEDWGEGYGSCYGDGLDVMAPGDLIASCDHETGAYSENAGTSFAAPFVAAASALAYTKDSNVNLAQVRAALEDTSRDLMDPGWDKETGSGLLQIDKFVNNFSITPSTPAVEGIEITGSELIELKPGESKELLAELLPAGALGVINWSSNNENVATINSTGVLTATGVGSCIITAECEGKQDSVQVNVIETEQPVYRLYDTANQVHLYTTDTHEVDTLVASGWKDEGTGWVAPLEGEPVYRLYHKDSKEHMYTLDNNEIQDLISRGWTVDNNSNPLFYSGGDKPIYRLYNDGIKRHLLTTYLNEYNKLPLQGWSQENIAFYSVR